MKRLVLIILLSLILTISAYAQFSLKVGETAPDFSGQSITGEKIDSTNLRGSVVVMTFWSTRCAICHHELPKLNQLTQRYNSKNVVFLALSMEPEERILDYVKTNHFSFKILPSSFGTVLKYADRNKNGNLDMGFPSFFVIDQQGVISYRSSGYDKILSLDAAVNKLL